MNIIETIRTEIERRLIDANSKSDQDITGYYKGVARGLQIVLSLLDKLEEPVCDEWIDICKTMRFPEDGQTVLTCCIDADGNMYQLLLAKYDSGLNEWIGQDGLILCVEYWMQIPKHIEQ